MIQREFVERGMGPSWAAFSGRHHSSARQRRRWILAVACLSCQGEESPPNTQPSGRGELRVGLGVAGADVTALRIDLVDADADCSAEPIASQTIELSPDGADAEANPRQSNAWFAVPPGEVRVCVTPLSSDAAPSARCEPIDDVARVEPGQSTEVRLVVQCRAPEDGILDTVVSLNEAPRVSQLTLTPGDVVTTCESVGLAATADDVDGDVLTYTWSVGDPLRLRPYEGTVEAAGPEASFSANIAGTYRVNLVIDDGHGGTTELGIPIEVTEGSCSRD